jgi:sugar/nucleoside kinase (ribokinase family)
MYDIISIGNISIDLYFKGQSLTHNEERFQLAIGGKYFADDFYEDVGGGGANVAAGLAKFGYKVAIFGKVGNNVFKEIILKKIAGKKVSSEFCQFEDNYYKISAILLTEKGERTIINFETPSHLYGQFILNDQLKKTKNIYFGPLPHIPLVEKTKMINFFKGDQATTVVNLAATDCQKPIADLNEIFQSLDILIVNSHEFSQLVKKPYREINFKDRAAINISSLKNRIVVVTDAEKGSYGYFNDEIVYQPSVVPAKIIDTTGCGDAYTAGFIAEYLKTKNVKSAMVSGAEYAAKILGKIGAN